MNFAAVLQSSPGIHDKSHSKYLFLPSIKYKIISFTIKYLICCPGLHDLLLRQTLIKYNTGKLTFFFHTPASFLRRGPSRCLSKILQKCLIEFSTALNNPLTFIIIYFCIVSHMTEVIIRKRKAKKPQKNKKNT